MCEIGIAKHLLKLLQSAAFPPSPFNKGFYGNFADPPALVSIVIN